MDSAVETENGPVPLPADFTSLVGEIGDSRKFLRISHQNGAVLILGAKHSKSGANRLYFVFSDLRRQRFCTNPLSSVDTLVRVIEDFLATGDRSPSVHWLPGDLFRFDHEPQPQSVVSRNVSARQTVSKKTISTDEPFGAETTIEGRRNAQTPGRRKEVLSRVVAVALVAACCFLAIGVLRVFSLQDTIEQRRKAREVAAAQRLKEEVDRELAKAKAEAFAAAKSYSGSGYSSQPTVAELQHKIGQARLISEFSRAGGNDRLADGADANILALQKQIDRTQQQEILSRLRRTDSSATAAEASVQLGIQRLLLGR